MKRKRRGFWLLCMVAAVAVLQMVVSCTDSSTGSPMKGHMITPHSMLLDGDTFRIKAMVIDPLSAPPNVKNGDTAGVKRMNFDTLFIVRNDSLPEGQVRSYLVRPGAGGLYYPLVGAKEISGIIGTFLYVLLDGKDIYDIEKGKVTFTSPCRDDFLAYLGKWHGMLVLSNIDSVCFTDGKSLELQNVTYCNRNRVKRNMVTLVKEVQKLDVPFSKLYSLATKHKHVKDTSVEKFDRYCYLKDGLANDDLRVGFSVLMDLPKGNSRGDSVMRSMLMRSVRDNIFELLPNGGDVPVSRCATLAEMKMSLDRYSVLWEKLCRAANRRYGTLERSLCCAIYAEKVADNSDYTTYYYYASSFNGGLHSLPRSYYITYDKKRGCLLDVSNFVHPSKVQRLRMLALKSMKAKFDRVHGGISTWEDYSTSVFANHSEYYDPAELDEDLHILYQLYVCDTWAGWDGCGGKNFTEHTFPLCHFALLPEGVVFTYHPYQLDTFAAGEFHAVIPYEEARDCLIDDYSNHPEDKNNLNRYVKL